MSEPTTKADAEVAKLNAEAAMLRGTPTWRVRTLLPTVVAALAVSASAKFFADSLEEQTHAEIRREVLTAYFSVENVDAGKRVQILDFVKKISTDDELLGDWVDFEYPRAEERLREASDGQQRAEAEAATLRERVSEARSVRAELVAKLLRPLAPELRRSDEKPERLAPGPEAKTVVGVWGTEGGPVVLSLLPYLDPVLTPGEQELVARLLELAEVPLIPDSIICAEYDYGEAELSRCRATFVEWANTAASSFGEDVSKRASKLEDDAERLGRYGGLG